MSKNKFFGSKQYKLSELDLKDLSTDPYDQFDKWYAQVLDSNEKFPNAVLLSTADSKGVPSSRIVLLKGYDSSGFIFYTNSNSKKGKEIDENPYVSLCFWWPIFERQLRIDGKVEILSEDITDEYFESRPRESQIGAWISDQSEVLKSRKVMEDEFHKFEKDNEGKKIKRPDFWKGYKVIPIEFEFWQGRDNRLHDRFRYILESKSEWKINRLYP